LINSTDRGKSREDWLCAFNVDFVVFISS
jgi:hypothetical protein